MAADCRKAELGHRVTPRHTQNVLERRRNQVGRPSREISARSPPCHEHVRARRTRGELTHRCPLPRVGNAAPICARGRDSLPRCSVNGCLLNVTRAGKRTPSRWAVLIVIQVGYTNLARDLVQVHGPRWPSSARAWRLVAIPAMTTSPSSSVKPTVSTFNRPRATSLGCSAMAGRPTSSLW